MSKEINLGAKLRETRMAKGKTIREVMEKTGISSSLISKIELGKATPSLSTLKRLTEELGVPMFYLFIENESRGSITRKEERVKLVVTGGIEEYLVTPDLLRTMEIVWTDGKPGASTGKSFMEHNSEECTLVIRGEICFYIGEERHILKEGDSIYLEPKVLHRWENPGSEPAALLSVYSLRSRASNNSQHK